MRSKHFTLEELVSPDILAVVSPWAAWRLVSPFVMSLDILRDMVDCPIEINRKGVAANRGLRPIDCKVGAKNSSHKGWEDRQGFDLVCNERELLIEKVKKYSKALGILRMENPAKTIGWVHIEIGTKPTDKELVVFDP